MRMPSRSAVTMAVILTLGACAAGPHQLRRSIDDWDNKLYVNSPWFDAALWVVPVIPVCTLGAWVVDFAITDPWFFWFGDAWQGAGTGFNHLDVQPTSGWVDSLLIERSGWTKVER